MTNYSLFQSNGSKFTHLSHFFEMVGSAVSHMTQFSSTRTSTTLAYENHTHSDDEVEVVFSCSTAASNVIVDMDEEVESLLYETSHDIGVGDLPLSVQTLN